VVATLMAAPPGHLVVFFYVSAVFFVFPAMVFIALSVVPSPRIIPLWMFLGDTSYAVYTLHVPVYFFLCSVIAAGWRGTLVDGAPLVGVGFLAVLLGVSYVADRIYDQPVRKWLKPLWRADRPAALAPAAR
jgi:peptidoglycan/LPS O-acetylase OafA/YrhL